MKRIAALLCGLTLVAFVACKKTEESTDTVSTDTVATDTAVVQTETTATTTISQETDTSAQTQTIDTSGTGSMSTDTSGTTSTSSTMSTTTHTQAYSSSCGGGTSPHDDMVKTFTTTLLREGMLCAIEVPFDPKEVFGKTRAPVKVTLNGYTYRSTISSMGGQFLIPLRKSNRDAAGLEGNETLEVRLELDTDVRDVEPPADLVKALKAEKLWDAWQKLSFTHRREHVEAVEGAKKPETRTRRIENAVKMIQAKR